MLVVVDEDRLAARGITPDAVATSLRSALTSIPSGRLGTSHGVVRIEGTGEITSLGDQVVATPGGVAVRLNDFARVEYGWRPGW